MSKAVTSIWLTKCVRVGEIGAVVVEAIAEGEGQGVAEAEDGTNEAEAEDGLSPRQSGTNHHLVLLSILHRRI